MRRRYPLYPTTDKTLTDTLAAFGVSRDSIHEITPEMRERADRFDVAAAIIELSAQIAESKKNKNA